MATFKAVVSPYRRADGTYRINIRVTHMRVHKDVPTPLYVTADQITRSGKIKDQKILDIVEDKIRDYRESATNIGFLADRLDIDHLIELLETKTDKLDFLEFMSEYANQMRKDGRSGTADMYESAKNSLKRFNDGKPLYFANITKQYMYKYFESLRDLKPNTQLNYIGKIEAAYRKAQQRYNNQELGITVVRYGVFDLIEKPTREASKDNAIKSVEQMQALIDEPYTGLWTCDLAKDMFILSFVCFGTNMADWLKMTHDQYRDGILYYRRKKVARQSKERADMQILMPEVGRIILDKYSGDSKYLINFGPHTRNDRFTRYIHYFFAKIGLEKLPEGVTMHDIGNYKESEYSFYAYRHTMASFAINICGIDYMTVHEMLNHAAPSNFKTTDAYIWRDYKHLWEANEKLLALFDWSFYEKQKRAER